MSSFVTCLSLVAILFLPVSTSAATYHLAPNGSDAAGDGSRQRPWKSIAQAVEKAADDGSTIVLADGVYEASQSVGRQFVRPLTIRAEHAYRTRLRSPAGKNRVLSCYGAANVTLQGLELCGSGGTDGEYLVHISTPKTHHLVFKDCLIHDGYNNDLVKVNDGAHHILFDGCVFFNQTDHEGDQQLDINTVTDVSLERCILFNDYAGSGRKAQGRSQGFVVVKNSGSTPDVTRRIAFRGNIWLNYEGKVDQAYLLLGEDGKPFWEAQQVLVENNLFIYNSAVRHWGAVLLKGGLKDITFRANTVVGHPVIQWSGAFGMGCLRIGKNPPMEGMVFCNNIYSDPSGKMPRFSMSDAKQFDATRTPILMNNLYWNAGKPITAEPQDTLVPSTDAAKLEGDPRLGDQQVGDLGKGLVLPRFDPAKGRFLSGEKTIRAEFERLVRLYGAPAAGSAALGKADATCMPKDDILGNQRSAKPNVGCWEAGLGRGGKSQIAD